MILICLSPGCPELSSWKGDRFKELVHAFGLVWFVSWQGSTSHNNRKSLTVAQQTNTLCTSAVLLMFQGHPILTHRHATRVMMRWSRSIGGLLPQLPVLNPHCSEVRRQFTAACEFFTAKFSGTFLSTDCSSVLWPTVLRGSFVVVLHRNSDAREGAKTQALLSSASFNCPLIQWMLYLQLVAIYMTHSRSHICCVTS